MSNGVDPWRCVQWLLDTGFWVIGKVTGGGGTAAEEESPGTSPLPAPCSVTLQNGTTLVVVSSPDLDFCSRIEQLPTGTGSG